MKRLLLALTFSTALTAPVSAGTIAQISGTGTGGNIALHGGSGSSIVGTTNVDVPLGKFIEASVSIRTTSGTNAITGAVDSAGNSYTCVPTIAINANGGKCYSYTTVDLPLGGTITVSFNVSGLCDIIASAWSNVGALDTSATPSPTNGAGTSMNVGTTGTLALGGTNELLLGSESMDTGGSQTDSGSWASLGTSGSNQVHAAAQLVTATTPVNLTVTSTVSNTWSGLILAFKSTGGATTPTNPMTFHAVP